MEAKVEAGGAFFGALLGSRLLGFAVIGAPLQGAAELCALFVDRRYPRSGRGSLLMDHVERAARDLGAKSPWLGSNSTASAVEFYLKHGCEAISPNRNDLARHRPADPVFWKPL